MFSVPSAILFAHVSGIGHALLGIERSSCADSCTRKHGELEVERRTLEKGLSFDKKNISTMSTISLGPQGSPFGVNTSKSA